MRVMLAAAMIVMTASHTHADDPSAAVERAAEAVRRAIDGAGLGDDPREGGDRWAMAIIGVVEPGADGARLIQRGVNLHDDHYYYPASAIKLLAAVSALERLNALRVQTGADLTADTPLVFHPVFDDQRLEDADPTNLDGGVITLRHEIRKLFIVSDNPAFNRLYGFIGRDGLNRRAWRAGLSSARVTHRLAEFRTTEENRRTPRVEMRAPDGRTVESPARRGTLDLDNAGLTGLRVGEAHYAGGERIAEPFRFDERNRISLADLQRALVGVTRPDVRLRGEPFAITDAQRQLLLDAMTAYPRESANPVYDGPEFTDERYKLLLPGLTRVLAQDELVIANKIGLAYGYVIENAYVKHDPSGRSFFVAAVVYSNPNRTLNDDTYGYAEDAFPLMAALGEALARTLLSE